MPTSMLSRNVWLGVENWTSPSSVGFATGSARPPPTAPAPALVPALPLLAITPPLPPLVTAPPLPPFVVPAASTGEPAAPLLGPLAAGLLAVHARVVIKTAQSTPTQTSRRSKQDMGTPRGLAR
jgi:hypothetical protein